MTLDRERYSDETFIATANALPKSQRTLARLHAKLGWRDFQATVAANIRLKTKIPYDLPKPVNLKPRAKQECPKPVGKNTKKPEGKDD
jgi:hypothetical protein